MKTLPLHNRLLLSILSLLLALAPLSILTVPKRVHAIPVQITSDISAQNHAATAYATSLTAGLETKEDIRENILNALAWFAAKALIRGITRSIVNWINTGFQGSPAFVTDPNAFLAGVVDEAIGNYINSTSLGFLCSPFQLEVRLALAFNYKRGRDVLSCRLTQIGNNIDNFFKGTSGSFSAGGGWGTWLQVVSQDNPYSRYQAASTELEIAIENARGEKIKLLDWGRGFFSFRDCSTFTTGGASNESGEQNCPIVTPGAFIEGQLSMVAGSDLRSLELADSINEILGTLAMQLVSQALGGAGGLLGTSRSGNGGGPSFLDQLAAQPFIPAGISFSIDANPRVAQEQNYRSAVQTTLDRVKQTERALVQVPACAVASALSILATRITSLKVELEGKIAAADNTIAYLRDLDRRLETASSTKDAIALTQEASNPPSMVTFHSITETVAVQMQQPIIAAELAQYEQQIAAESALCSASSAGGDVSGGGPGDS